MGRQGRVLGEQGLRFTLRRADNGLVATNRQESQVRGRPGLPRPQDVTFLAQAQVCLGELKAISRSSEGL